MRLSKSTINNRKTKPSRRNSFSYSTNGVYMLIFFVSISPFFDFRELASQIPVKTTIRPKMLQIVGANSEPI